MKWEHSAAWVPCKVRHARSCHQHARVRAHPPKPHIELSPQCARSTTPTAPPAGSQIRGVCACAAASVSDPHVHPYACAHGAQHPTTTTTTADARAHALTHRRKHAPVLGGQPPRVADRRIATGAGDVACGLHLLQDVRSPPCPERVACQTLRLTLRLPLCVAAWVGNNGPKPWHGRRVGREGGGRGG